MVSVIPDCLADEFVEQAVPFHTLEEVDREAGVRLKFDFAGLHGLKLALELLLGEATVV